MTIPNLIALLGAVFFGSSGWLTLLIRQKAREEAQKEFTEMIEGKLAQFKVDLLALLGGPTGFRRAESCLDKMGSIAIRVEAVEAKIDSLSEYAHTNNHRLANEIQILMNQRDVQRQLHGGT